MSRCGGVVAALLAALVVAPVTGDAVESEAPYCEDIEISQEQMETATQEAMATGQFNNAWTDPAQWDGVMKAVESQLGCRLTKPVSPESAELQTRAHAASSEAEARTVYESAQADAQALAYNIYCPTDLLAALSAHEAPDVRATVAVNPKTPADVLAGLAADSNPSVALAAQRRLQPETGTP